MHADQRGLKHFGLTEKIIGIFYEVYNELGHGFLESVYEQAMAIALAEHQIFFQRQIEVGLLLNFGPAAQLRRLVFDNERKKIGVNPCESAEKNLGSKA